MMPLLYQKGDIFPCIRHIPNYQANTKHPDLDQISNDIIYQNKFIKSIQRPLQSLAAFRTVFGTHNRC